MIAASRLASAVALTGALSILPSGAGATTPPPMRVLVKPVDVGENPRVRVDVPVPTGVEDPSGEVVVLVIGEDYRVRRTKEWSGSDVVLVTARVVQAGRYVVRARFRSATGDVADQSAARTFRVTRR